MTADLVAAYVGMATAAGSGIWAVTRYFMDRQRQREQERQLADQQLKQAEAAERSARQERAAALVQQLGMTSDPRSRRWTMSALALYGDEILDVLLGSLGEADTQDAAAVKLAVISVGPAALSRVVRVHRIAAQLSRTKDSDGQQGYDVEQRTVDIKSASRVLDCTREIVLNLLFQLEDGERSAVDLAEVDLSRVMLVEARLPGIRLRKTRLDGAVLNRAQLAGAILRGASMQGTVLTSCDLRAADLTGASGAVNAIAANLDDACLDQAKFANSNFDGAHLKGASLHNTKLAHASLAGAAMNNAKLVGASLRGTEARKLSAGNLQCTRSDLAHAVLVDARLPQCEMEDSKLSQLSASRMQAAGSLFTNCHMPGADFTEVNFSESQFKGCNFGGTKFGRALLSSAVFTSCEILATDFTAADLRKVRFVKCRFGNVSFYGVNLETAIFEGCTFVSNAKLGIDNESWEKATLDTTARDAFNRAIVNDQ